MAVDRERLELRLQPHAELPIQREGNVHMLSLNSYNQKVMKKGRRKSAFFIGFWAGLAAPGAVMATPSYTYPHASDNDALRSDWARVGTEIRGAMHRNDVKTSD